MSTASMIAVEQVVPWPAVQRVERAAVRIDTVQVCLPPPAMCLPDFRSWAAHRMNRTPPAGRVYEVPEAVVHWYAPVSVLRRGCLAPGTDADRYMIAGQLRFMLWQIRRERLVFHLVPEPTAGAGHLDGLTAYYEAGDADPLLVYDRLHEVTAVSPASRTIAAGAFTEFERAALPDFTGAVMLRSHLNSVSPE
ncbi:hypothetical protein [Streptomyces albidoflavus]|uniref:hypothetical protein n=1 Tax=Streptomyces albidoflavus TaxID=1886 RepID=UPI0002493DA9|nr:hypothetical protein [Streptomyces albidoflavus]MBV7652687.1 hypothetical protein [Streptomyces albidoflavus]MBV7714156.1 hypothetical protein [Streptomyces albidoflavus]RZE14598.1 hypothetical protein C0Q66_00305 [Streptomyces albidoflavus]